MADLTLHSNTESFIGDIKRLVEQGRNAAYGAVNAVIIHAADAHRGRTAPRD